MFTLLRSSKAEFIFKLIHNSFQNQLHNDFLRHQISCVHQHVSGKFYIRVLYFAGSAQVCITHAATSDASNVYHTESDSTQLSKDVCLLKEVEFSWNVMAHGDAREKWTGNIRMEWETTKNHMTAEYRLARVVQNLKADVHSSAASSRLNWRPADLNGLARFAERRILVSARVPSHFKRSLRHRALGKIFLP